MRKFSEYGGMERNKLITTLIQWNSI